MANSALSTEWQQTAWQTMAPRLQQVAYLSGLGWKADDIADELFLMPMTVTKMRDTLRRMSPESPTNYEPFASMTSPAILELTTLYVPTEQVLIALAELPDHQRAMLERIAEGKTMVQAGVEVYGYEIETGQIETTISEGLGLSSRTQLQVLVMRAQNDPQIAAGEEAVTTPVTPAA